MNISQSALAWLYLYALLLGVFLGAVYDILRITRVFLGVHYSRRAAKRLQEIKLPFLAPHKKRSESRALGIVVFLEDLLFCIFAGIALILLFYEANNGKFRFPVVLAAGAGFLLYRGTLGRLVMLFSEVIAFFIETVLRYAVFFLLFPVRMLFGWICRCIRRAVERSIDARRKKMRRRYTVAESARVSKNACGLVPENMPEQRKIKRGKSVDKGKEKTIQSHHADADPSRRAGGSFHRGVCK